METVVHTIVLKPSTSQVIDGNGSQNYVAFYPMREHHLANNTKMLDVFCVNGNFDFRNYDTMYEHAISLAQFEEPFLPEFLHDIQAWQILAFYIRPKNEKTPKFKEGDKVKIIKLLDEMTSRDLIGKVSTIQEVDPLPNGDFNYYVDGHYMHEAELEAA